MDTQTTQPTTDTSQLDPSVIALMHGLKMQEGGGQIDYNAVGDEGTAAGAGQWSNQPNGKPVPLQKGQIPYNFQMDAKQYGLDPNDFSPANQNQVMYRSIEADKKSGLTPEQILSKWNSGDPNAYQSATSSGTGPVGKYNVAQYVSQAMKYAQEYAQKNQNNNQTDNQGEQSGTNGSNQNQPESLLQKGGDVLKSIGNFLFPIVGDIGADLQGKSDKNPLEQAADLGLSALSVIPGLDFGPSEALEGVVEGGEAAAKSGILQKILGSSLAKGAGIGALGGGLSAISQGGGLKQALTGAATGGLTGGALGGAFGALSSSLDSLPTRITQNVFKGITPETAEYALQNKSLGSVSKMLSDSEEATNGLGTKIKSILGSPQYANSVGNGDKALQDTLDSFGNSDLATKTDVAESVKNVVPTQTKLVDKVLSGEATLAEKNTLRSAIDKAVYPKNGDLPKLTFDKGVANTFGNNLRNEVQTMAPETKSLFSDFSNEIKLKKSLIKMNKQGTNIVSFPSLMSSLIGLGASGGNPLGAAGGYAIEKLFSTPEGKLLIAKMLNKGGSIINSKASQYGGTLSSALAGRLAGSSQAIPTQ